MAFVMRQMKVPPNSASLEEARERTLQLFKQACRSIPTIMDIHNLHDVVTHSQLRSTISSEFRKNSHITNPKRTAAGIKQIIDMLLFKGLEELSNIVEHAKQRHHVIGQYVIGRGGLVQDTSAKDQGMSDFLKKFYSTNYF